MRNYELNYGGQVFPLPSYTFDIADKLEKQEQINAGTGRLRDKCKSMYNLIVELLGTDNAQTALGDFSKVDPNEINVVYLLIVQAYNKPLQEYQEENVFSQLDNSNIDKLINLVGALEKSQHIRFGKQ